MIEIRNVIMGSNDWHAVFFEVDRYWKSPNPNDNDSDYYKELVVFTSISENLCGYEFEEDKTYLVYALPLFPDYANSLNTGLGAGNKPIGDAKEDLAILGEGILPTKEAGLEDQVNRTITAYAKIQSMPTTQEQVMNLISFIAIGGAAASIVAFFSMRRLRNSQSHKS